jgi:hypothetical protein
VVATIGLRGKKPLTHVTPALDAAHSMFGTGEDGKDQRREQSNYGDDHKKFD